MKHIKKKSEGITLIEILVVVGIIIVMAVLASPLGIDFMQKNHLKNTKDTLVSYLNSSKIYAMSGKHDGNWGVYITTDKITLFQGQDYLNRNTTFDQDFEIPETVTITPLEIVFAKETGNTAGGTIDLTGEEGSIFSVVIDSQGNISVI